jgi:hypothetical protein
MVEAVVACAVLLIALTASSGALLRAQGATVRAGRVREAAVLSERLLGELAGLPYYLEAADSDDLVGAVFPHAVPSLNEPQRRFEVSEDHGIRWGRFVSVLRDGTFATRLEATFVVAEGDSWRPLTPEELEGYSVRSGRPPSDVLRLDVEVSWRSGGRQQTCQRTALLSWSTSPAPVEGAASSQ